MQRIFSSPFLFAALLLIPFSASSQVTLSFETDSTTQQAPLNLQPETLLQSARIVQADVSQLYLSTDQAAMEAEPVVESNADEVIYLKVSSPDNEFEPVVIKQFVTEGFQTLKLSFQIPQPIRWWPAGMGEQKLYTVRMELLSADEEPLDLRDLKIGLRSIHIAAADSSKKAELKLTINGKPLLMRGLIHRTELANDVMQTEIIEHVMNELLGANMNFLHVTNDFETDDFYDIADRKGLFLAQSMHTPPLDPTLDSMVVALQATKLENQIKRLRHHPSLALWTTEPETRSYSDSYRQNSDRPYIPFSLLPDAESPDFAGMNTDLQLLTAVLQRQDPERMLMQAPSEDLLESPLLNYKNVLKDIGYPTIKTDTLMQQALKAYPPAKDQEALAQLGRLIAAEKAKQSIETVRGSNHPMLNRLPLLFITPDSQKSESVLNGKLNPNPILYDIKEAFALLQIHTKLLADELQTTILSDREEPTPAELELKLMDFDGNQTWVKRLQVQVPAMGVNPLPRLDISEQLAGIDRSNHVLLVDLKVNGSTAAKHFVYLDSIKNLRLRSPEFNRKIELEGDHFLIRLSVKSLTKNLYLDFPDGGGLFRFDRNNFDLLPGETAIIRLDSKLTEPQVNDLLRITSLFDLFEEGAFPPYLEQQKASDAGTKEERKPRGGFLDGLKSKEPRAKTLKIKPHQTSTDSTDTPKKAFEWPNDLFKKKNKPQPKDHPVEQREDKSMQKANDADSAKKTAEDAPSFFRKFKNKVMKPDTTITKP